MRYQNSHKTKDRNRSSTFGSFTPKEIQMRWDPNINMFVKIIEKEQKNNIDDCNLEFDKWK